MPRTTRTLNASNPPDTISSVLTEVLTADTELRTRVKGLILSLVTQAEFTMRHGTPHDKAVLMRAAVPAMMRALSTAEADEAVRQERAAYERLRLHLVSARSTELPPIQPPVPIDSPPAA